MITPLSKTNDFLFCRFCGNRDKPDFCSQCGLPLQTNDNPITLFGYISERVYMTMIPIPRFILYNDTVTLSSCTFFRDVESEKFGTPSNPIVYRDRKFFFLQALEKTDNASKFLLVCSINHDTVGDCCNFRQFHIQRLIGTLHSEIDR